MPSEPPLFRLRARHPAAVSPEHLYRMPNYSTDRERTKRPGSITRTPDAGHPRVAPLELVEWLQQKLPAVREQWARRIHENGLGRSDPWDRIIDEFTYLLVAFLPPLLGPLRGEVRPIWDRCAELFGATAAQRGLAAGEVIEELQVLRELVIRELYRDPPMGGQVPLSLREILQLNRAIDRAVTHGSVGHTDALFFELFEQGEHQDPVPPEALAEEVRKQLGVIRAEFEAVVRVLVTAGQESTKAH